MKVPVTLRGEEFLNHRHGYLLTPLHVLLSRALWAPLDVIMDILWRVVGIVWLFRRNPMKKDPLTANRAREDLMGLNTRSEPISPSRKAPSEPFMWQAAPRVWAVLWAPKQVLIYIHLAPSFRDRSRAPAFW